MFQRILVPVDGTKGSESAIPYALELAQALGAEVLVCHVITTPVTPNSSCEEREAATYVTRIAERFRSGAVVARTQVCRGDPAREIRKIAIDWSVDAIIMATRSRRRLEKLMLGSVADALVRDSRLPVLLVSSRRSSKQPQPRPAQQPSASRPEVELNPLSPAGLSGCS